MAIRQYTREQLLHLRNSPLVKKPEDLPAIEQWIEYVYLDVDGTREKLRIPHSESQQSAKSHVAAAGRQQRTTGAAEAAPMGSFGQTAGQGQGQGRPRLGEGGGGVTREGEERTLGPPKTLFTSSKSTARLSDFDKPSTPLTEAALKEETDRNDRNIRTFGDKQTNRKSMGTNDTDDKLAGNWAVARERRALAGDEEKVDGAERNGRYGKRDREPDGEGRNGYGNRQDSRWHRDEKRTNTEGKVGWREREKERRDRGWGRDHHDDKEPAWMDEPAPRQDEDMGALMGMPKNQEEFERWKKEQHARNKKSVEEPPEALPASPPPMDTAKEVVPPKTVAPLKLDGVVDRPFGNWGEGKTAGGLSDSVSTPAKSVTAKGKTSRFAPMFKKDEPKEEVQPTATAQSAPVGGQDNPEDKAGFDRILQMLGNTGLSSQSPTSNEPASPPPRQVSNGGKPKSRFTGFFDQTPKSPERMQSPDAPMNPTFRPMQGEILQGGRGISEEPGNVFGPRIGDRPPVEQPPRTQPPASVLSPDSVMSSNGGPYQRPQSGRMNDIFLDPPSRNASTPELNIQNLLATKPGQRHQGADNKNSQFLLDLLQTKSARPQSQQARPDDNFQLWREQPPNVPETHAPKPRAPPPPGLFEDQLLRNHPQELSRHDQPPMPSNEMLQRRASQRAPPGFFDEQQQQLFQHQQQQHHQQQHHQRNFTEPSRQFQQQQQHQPGPGRRMSGHPNLPQMLIPQQQQANPPPPFPAEFLQSPSAAPPPGFNPHMPRHPPGIHNIPNIFSTPQPQSQLPPSQQQQQQLLQRERERERDVPSYVQQLQQTVSPPGAPPGFFGAGGLPPPQQLQGLPPGFMGMRSPMESAQVQAGGRRFDGYGSGLGGGLGQGR